LPDAAYTERQLCREDAERHEHDHHDENFVGTARLNA
jgi:hypothetical protein